MTDTPFAKFLSACVMAWFVVTSPVKAEEEDREGGLTGTGIVGEISALGSIIVNDQRITFDPDLAVTSVLAGNTASDLVPGDVVAVAVEPAEQDWRATEIRQMHALVGPVGMVSTGRLSVLGVDVAWQGPAPAVGDWVAISGFWTPTGVTATRIENIAPQASVHLLGSYREDPSGPTSMVGSLQLNLEPLRHANEGEVIEVIGTLDSGALRVTDVRRGLFDAPVSFVLAEGYLTDVAPSGHYTVAGSGLSAYTDNLQSIMTTDRVRVCGAGGLLGARPEGALVALMARLGCPEAAN